MQILWPNPTLPGGRVDRCDLFSSFLQTDTQTYIQTDLHANLQTYTHIHTDADLHTDLDTQTYRHTDVQLDIQIDLQIYRPYRSRHFDLQTYRQPCPRRHLSTHYDTM